MPQRRKSSNVGIFSAGRSKAVQDQVRRSGFASCLGFQRFISLSDSGVPSL
jgi:hypothetical protein